MARKFYCVANLACGTTVCHRAQVADTTLTRLFGLLGSKALAIGEGLLIEPSSGVHTWGMSFPIDIVALDRNLRVIRLSPNTGPWKIRGVSLCTRSVLELPAGQIERTRLAVGDTLHITRAS